MGAAAGSEEAIDALAIITEAASEVHT